jgi:hypothetical protein
MDDVGTIHSDGPTWYPNPVRKTAVIGAVSTFVLFTVIGTFFAVTRGPLVGVPLLLFLSSLSGILMIHIIRIERRVKPGTVAIVQEGMLFRYSNGLEQLKRWDDISELSMVPREPGAKEFGIVILEGSKDRIPIPYEAYEEALVMRRTRGTRRA